MKLISGWSQADIFRLVTAAIVPRCSSVALVLVTQLYEFLTRRRLREAVRELDRTNKKILDIANDTGFPNLKAFNTRFRELFERTPSEYRSSLKQVRVPGTA